MEARFKPYAACPQDLNAIHGENNRRMGSPIPFVDLLPQYLELKEPIDAAIAEVIADSAFIRGTAVAAFEKTLAESVQTSHAVGVASATAGLWITLRALDIGPGDEVITTVHTAVCTAEAIVQSGAKVRFVDIDPRTWQISPSAVEAAISPATKAIMPVHLYGIPCDLDAIMAIAARAGIPVIEDCAQAQGAEHRGRRVGGIGDAGVFSFFPSKNLGAMGDAGAICTNRADIALFATMFSNHGRVDKYFHEIIGTNERMDTLHAAVLGVKIGRLDAWNAHRRAVADRYLELLADVPGIVLPECHPDTTPVWHLFVIRTGNRDGLAAHLRGKGIGTGIHYPTALHEQPSMAGGHKAGDFPVAEAVCRECLSLPMYPHLPVKAVDTVVAEIRNYLGVQGAASPAS